MSEAQPRLCDAFLYRSNPGSKESMTTFFNLISNAVTYGMAMGSARTGLGTDIPVGDSIPGPSLYYQALQAYSAFDWEFQQQLTSTDAAHLLPRETLILAGRFPEVFLNGFKDEHLEDVATAQRIACTLAPSLKPFAFRRMAEGDQSLNREHGGVQFSAAIRESLWRGSRAKLQAIADAACRAKGGDLETKLATMASAFTPLCTVFGAAFDEEDRSKSYTRLAIYLPALHTLHADDVDDPSGWFLERGLPTLSLPSPVQVSAARITHMSYLRGAKRSLHQGIVLEVRRDFCEPQRVSMVLGFGRLFAKSSKDLLGIDCSEHQDALCLQLHGHVPANAGDSDRVRQAKERANRAFSGFSIEARIHQLTLHLSRDDASKSATEEQLLRPQFSLDESKISFRIERHTESRAERLSLQAAGFAWEEANDRTGYLCWREFWTWDRLREFFGDEAVGGQGLGGLLVTGREKLLGQAARRATKLVLDHSIESIEQSLDKEIARLVGEALDRYSTARDALAHRLHKGLFDAP